MLPPLNPLATEWNNCAKLLGGRLVELAQVGTRRQVRQLLLEGAHLRSIDLSVIAACTATNVARRFGLARKGEVAIGFDADLWIADLSHESLVRREDLLYRNAFSAHEGQAIRGRTVMTLVRGRAVFAKGRPIPGPGGRLLTAQR